MASAPECQPIQELLSDLAEGELEAPEAARVEAHVSACADCRAQVALFRGVVANLIAIGEEEAPAELSRRVMARVHEPSLAERIVTLLTLPFQPGFLRVAVPTVAVVLLAIALRPLMPDNRVPASPDHVAGVPVWWGGNLLVNDVPHAPNKSGRLGLKSGDSVRTRNKVEAALPIRSAQVEVKPNTSLIVTDDGISIQQGEIVVHIDDHKPSTDTFRVISPDAVIEHIGTTFRVMAAPGEYTRAEVFQGKIRVISTGGVVHEMTAGEFVRVLPSGAIEPGPETIPADSLGSNRGGPDVVKSITQPLPGAPGTR
jgi:hypothetical protein